MSRISDNLKFQLKKVALVCSLSLALFFASYYVVNFIDLGSAEKVSEFQATQNLIGENQELQKRAGNDNVNLAAFEDWTKINNLSGENLYDADPDKDGLANYLEYIYGTDPSNADSDGDKFSDKQEITNGYDPDAKGDAMTIVSLKIDKLGVNAPMIWSKTDDEKVMLSELEKGIGHFMKTAAPGQNGNMIISGHSSNYIWAKGGYNYVFEKLNDLQAGDMVTFQTAQKNGHMIAYKYKITEKFVALPDDGKIFANTENPTVTLSTCWPLGTNLKRLIVKGELVK